MTMINEPFVDSRLANHFAPDAPIAPPLIKLCKEAHAKAQERSPMRCLEESGALMCRMRWKRLGSRLLLLTIPIAPHA